MRAIAGKTLALAAATGALVALFWWARATGAIEGPDERFADFLLLPLPFVLLYAGFATWRLARTSGLAARIPQRLPRRIESPAKTTPGGIWFYVRLLTFVWLAAAAFVVSLYPRDWSSSWECTSDGDGETSCNLAEGTFLRYGLFVIDVLVVPLFVLFGIPAGIAGVLAMRREARLAEPFVELSDGRLEPGSRFEIVVRQPGRESVDVVRANLVCTESVSYTEGTDTRSDTAEVLRVAIAAETYVAAEQGAPVVDVARAVVVPPRAMPSWAATHNHISWAVVVEVVCGGHARKAGITVQIAAPGTG